MLTADTLTRHPELSEKLLGKDLASEELGVRFRLPDQWKAFTEGQFVDVSSLDILDKETWLRDELMLKLRTDQRISDRSKYVSILEKDREKQLEKWVAQ